MLSLQYYRCSQEQALLLFTVMSLFFNSVFFRKFSFIHNEQKALSILNVESTLKTSVDSYLYETQ